MGEKIRVLVVDDIEETRKNVITLLEIDERIEVVGEGINGVEAIELCGEIKPKVVLMDINMPIMDGLRATEEITRLYPEIIVIIMSVHGEREYIKRAMDYGAKEYITKPFSFDDLVNTIIKSTT